MHFFSINAIKGISKSYSFFLLGIGSITAAIGIRQLYAWYKERTAARLLPAPFNPNLQTTTQINFHQNKESKKLNVIRLASRAVDNPIENEIVVFKNEHQEFMITFFKQSSLVRLTASAELSQLLSRFPFEGSELPLSELSRITCANIYECVFQNLHSDLLGLYRLSDNSIHINHCPIRLASHPMHSQSVENEITIFKNECQQFIITFFKKASQEESSSGQLVAPAELSLLLSTLSFDNNTGNHKKKCLIM